MCQQTAAAATQFYQNLKRVVSDKEVWTEN
jgi:hypothetical protein